MKFSKGEVFRDSSSITDTEVYFVIVDHESRIEETEETISENGDREGGGVSLSFGDASSPSRNAIDGSDDDVYISKYIVSIWENDRWTDRRIGKHHRQFESWAGSHIDPLDLDEAGGVPPEVERVAREAML